MRPIEKVTQKSPLSIVKKPAVKIITMEPTGRKTRALNKDNAILFPPKDPFNSSYIKQEIMIRFSYLIYYSSQLIMTVKTHS
jgi:hypothetical protein